MQLASRNERSWVWQHMLLIPTLGKQGQGDLCELGASMVYMASLKPPMDTQ